VTLQYNQNVNVCFFLTSLVSTLDELSFNVAFMLQTEEAVKTARNLLEFTEESCLVPRNLVCKC
jgi:hypothetical protein